MSDEIEHEYGLSDSMKNWTPMGKMPKYGPEEYRKINTCFRPDYFFENKIDGKPYCDGCPMLEYCGCKTKVMQKRSS